MVVWSKYLYVCEPDDCDASIEVVSKTKPQSAECLVCGRGLNLISVEMVL